MAEEIFAACPQTIRPAAANEGWVDPVAPRLAHVCLCRDGLAYWGKTAVSGECEQRSRPAAERPAAAVPGGPGRGHWMPRVDPVCAFAFVGFEGLDGIARLFHGAGHEAADGVLLPSHLVHDLCQGGAVFPQQQGDHLSGFAAFARRRAFP